jgi:hypothetical protein
MICCMSIDGIDLATGDGIVRLLDKLHGGIHGARVSKYRNIDGERAQLILDPGRQGGRTVGPIEAAISLELVRANPHERHALAGAGYVVTARGRSGGGLARLSAVLQRARLVKPTRQEPPVPKTGRHRRQGPARRTPGPVPGAADLDNKGGSLR